MNGHELCGVYLAVKLHFTSEKYNYFTSSGKIKIGVDAFQKRKDKYLFHKLARKLNDDEVVPFLVANFINSGETWTRTLVSDGADTVYTQWKKNVESLSYVFENDFQKIVANGKINDMFDAKDGAYPEVFMMYMHGELALETMVILNNMMQYLKVWDKKITDTVVYPKVAMKIRKYGSFLTLDLDKMKRIAKKHLTLETA
jgi:hypothetical protein